MVTKTLDAKHSLGLPFAVRRMHAFRTAATVVFFLCLLLLTDQALLHWGDSLVRAGYFRDDIYLALAESKPGRLVLLGDCRPMVLPTSRLAALLERPVVNMGASSSGLAHIALTANILMSKTSSSNQTAVLFLNDEILEQSQSLFEDELERLFLWWPHLSTERSRWFAAQPGGGIARNPLRKSGLWKYRGRGASLLRSSLRAWRGVVGERSPDWDNSNWTYGAGSLAGVESTLPPAKARYDESAFGKAWLHSLLGQMSSAGVKVILVLSPMHERRATDAVNQSVIRSIRDLAGQHHVPLISHLGGGTEWSQRSDWYGEQGHLNDAGVAAYTPVLAQELKALLP